MQAHLCTNSQLVLDGCEFLAECTRLFNQWHQSELNFRREFCYHEHIRMLWRNVVSYTVSSVRIGTRGSALARWQTDYVQALLHDCWLELDIQIQVISTQGDRVLDTPLPLVGGKGVFTAELEAALRKQTIDLAVHSLKDLPTEQPEGLTIAAVPARASAGDVLVSREGYTLATLPDGAIVGTSSRRRAAQLLHRRPDLRIIDLRGNVDTRVRKALAPDSPHDAIVLAQAGLERLGQTGVISESLGLDDVLPAPGQGALAVQSRDDEALRRLLSPLDHLPTRLAVTAERAFLAGLGGGCSLPIAAYAEVKEEVLHLHGRVTAPDGGEQIDVTLSSTADLSSAHELGLSAARDVLGQGADRLLVGLQ